MSQDHTAAEVGGFDFAAPAELYMGRGTPRRHGMRFKQFDSAAEAIQYAMERPRALGEVATMECDDKRFGAAEIAGLYHDAAYPLPRLSAAVAEAERPSIAVPVARVQKNEIPAQRLPETVNRAAAVALPPPVQHHHRYKVGMRLRMDPGGASVSRQGSYCKVTFVLPFERGQLLYRVKSEIEAFERVVAEADLSVVAAGT